MSLRLIHIFFIIAADSLCVFFGVWSFTRGDAQTAAGAFVLSALLCVYLVWFISKSKGTRS